MCTFGLIRKRNAREEGSEADADTSHTMLSRWTRIERRTGNEIPESSGIEGERAEKLSA